MLPNILLLKNKPPTPPSRSGNVKRENVKESLTKLFTNKDYLILLFIAGVFFGALESIGVVLSNMISPFGMDASNVSYIGGVMVFTGIICIMVASYLISKFRKYKVFIYVCTIGNIGKLYNF